VTKKLNQSARIPSNKNLMTKKKRLLVFANRGREIVNISEVQNGLACNCTCLKCGQPLVAKNNDKNIKIKHFAHINEKECKGAFETTIHKVAKQIIYNKGKIVTPTLHYKNEIIQDVKEIVFDTILSEDLHKTTMGSKCDKSLIKPDLIGIYKHQKLLIEIAVTHKTDEEKLQKIIRSKISAIEIDLSNLSQFSFEDIEREIFNAINIRWLHNEKCELIYNRTLKSLIKKGIKLINFDIEAYEDVPWGGPNHEKCNISCPLFFREEIEFKQSQFATNHIIKDILNGAFWNRKIYGNKINFFIHLNGKKIALNEDDYLALYELEKIRPIKHITECELCKYHIGIFSNFVKCGSPTSASV